MWLLCISSIEYSYRFVVNHGFPFCLELCHILISLDLAFNLSQSPILFKSVNVNLMLNVWFYLSQLTHTQVLLIEINTHAYEENIKKN